MSSEILEIKARRLLAEEYVREATFLECGAGTPREEQLRRVEAAGQALRRGLDPPRADLFTKILVATDGSPEAQRAERLAADLAAERHARLLLVCVADTRWAHGPDEVAYSEVQLRAALREKVDRYLAEASDRLSAGVPAERSRLEGEPATEILKAASEWGANLLVMGTRGRGRLRGLLLGSTAQEVLHGAKCPVLLVVAHAAVEDAPQQPVPTAAVANSTATGDPGRTG
jgi:nucleotide-binding universal stress UspA family protein